MHSKVTNHCKIINKFRLYHKKNPFGYYKVTNEHETHHGFKYVDGLNVLKEKFNNNFDYSCGPGGFYFTTLRNIPNFYGHGINIREISIPDSDPDFRSEKYM